MANELPRFEMRPLGQEEGGGYLIEFPEYPGCVADGATPEEAMEEGADALESYRNTLRELGRPIPASGDVFGGNACRSRFTPRWRAVPTMKACLSTCL